jgi:hypothetical protein
MNDGVRVQAKLELVLRHYENIAVATAARIAQKKRKKVHLNERWCKSTS